MVSETFIATILEKVKAKPMGEFVPLDRSSKGYAATVEALKTIIDRRIDKVFGFELLFIPDNSLTLEWFCEAQRIPGRDYQPIAFKKYSL